jgi:hypothetical protein
MPHRRIAASPHRRIAASPHRRIASLTLVLTVFSVVSCSTDSATGVVTAIEPPQLSPAVSRSSTVNQYELAASLLASALESEAFRTALRDDFRNSPFSEHKLLLSRAFGTADGLAGTLLGETDAQLYEALATVAMGTAIEISIPGSDARRTWRPSQPLPVYAYSGRNGGAITRVSDNGRLSQIPISTIDYAPMLLVAPAEQMARRSNFVMSTTAMIEGPNESQLGAVRLVSTPFGLREVASTTPILARLEACEDWTCDPGNGGGSGPQDTTFLKELRIFDVVDNGMPWTDNEFEWHSLYTVGGVATAYNVLRITGIPKDYYANYSGVILITQKPSITAGAVIYVNVIETDTFGNDTFGPTIVLTNPTNYFPNPLYSAGADRCAYALANFGLPCVSGGVQYKETNQNFFYN